MHNADTSDDNKSDPTCTKFYISTGNWMTKNDEKNYYLDCLKLDEKYHYSIVVGYQAYTSKEHSPKIGIDLVIGR